MMKPDDFFFVKPRDCFAERTGAKNDVRALVDGESAMRAIQEAILTATSHVYIAGWDIDPEITLVRDAGGQAPTLRNLLVELRKREPAVDVRVLIWCGVGANF